MLVYRKVDHVEVIGYMKVPNDRKSTLEFFFFFMLANEAISWKSAKQTLVASSTM